MTNRSIRLASWALILALAGIQSYAHRYAVSPDGISYLDLSDAVVTGRLGDLVNLYWSPLYPFLVGLARLAVGTGARTEVAAMHAANVACFAALLAAFEYFFIKILSISAGLRRTPLGGRWGPVLGYAVFGAVALTLNPLELTTPDLLSNAAILLALGAMLRLHDEPAATRHGVVLGVALGLGLLAKSFLVPWGVVCLVVTAVDVRARSRRGVAAAAAVWLVFLLPWTAVLSARAGRLTFGDAGRLTYGWYVNGQDAPSLRVVPPGARTADLDALLPGIGATGDAPGTDPMWFDPARWNAPIRPHFSFSDQRATFTTMMVTFVGSLAILTYFVFFVFNAPRGSRRRAWRLTWVVIVPSIAGVLAYAAVIMTARYVMAFILVGVIVILATIPVARRLRPTMVLLGMVASLLPLGIDSLTRGGFALAVAVSAAILVGVLVPMHRRAVWLVAIPLTLVATLLLVPPREPSLMRAAGAAFALVIWLASRAAIRAGRTHRFAVAAQAALAVSLTVVLVGRVGLRMARDAGAAGRAGASSPEWMVAQDLAAHGIVPGTRIALIGPHAESYWARTARVKIVANVPDPLAPFWWTLPAARRDSTLAKFAAHGAQVAIATRPSPLGAVDAGWTPLAYGGWMRPLSRPR